MTDMYKDVCTIILDRKDARDQLIRKTVVTIIPTLASYDPTTFADQYLHKSMSHLLGLLRKDRDKRDGKLLLQISRLFIWNINSDFSFSIYCHWTSCAAG